ncbi:MAG: carboxypeptidase regulatory-like domain-containing protein [Opitutus sp.]
MNYFSMVRASIRVCTAFAGIVTFSCTSFAQSAPTGAIVGRVQNVVKGDYVDNAQVTIEGTNRSTLTDSLGQYRFTNVPAGTTQIRAYYTGLEPQMHSVTLEAGQTVKQDFDLLTAAATAAREANPSVVLDQFVVTAVKDTNNASIAINEQRFAANMKTVVSTEEFGNIAEGNLGEFLKFVPGLTVEYTGGEVRQIQLAGAPGQYTNIMMNGFQMASAASGGTARTIELEQVSTNNVSRIEYIRSPTPESPGSSLSGYINMIPRNSFERSRPSGSYQVFMEMTEKNFLNFSKQPGPYGTPTRKVGPGGTFNYINPVNDKFGFTLSGSTSAKDLLNQGFVFERFGSSNIGVPPAGSPYNNSNPYPQIYAISDNPIAIRRSSWSTTLDFKPQPNDVLSLGMTWASYDGRFGGRDINFNAGSAASPATAPISAGVDYVHGAPGVGTITIGAGTSLGHKTGVSYMPSLTWRHVGPVWNMEAGAAYSHSTNHYRDISEGNVNAVVLQRSNVTINFDKVGPQAPGQITVIDNAPGHVGEIVDFRKLSSYNVIRQVYAPKEGYDIVRSVYGKTSRFFDLPWTSLNVKAGFDVHEQSRDNGQEVYQFNPVAGSSSVNAGWLVDQSFLTHAMPYVGGVMEWQDFAKPSQDLANNPKNWVANGASATNPTGGDAAVLSAHRLRSKHATEVVSAGFLQGELSFLNRRLQMTAGLRAEQTNVKGEGPLTNAALGKPFLAGSLDFVKATIVERGDKTNREYLTLFPDINASFNIRPNLIARVAAYTSIGRPDFAQYAAGATLPDLGVTPTPTGPFITVSNPLLKPWTSVTESASLEYYFPGVGVFSVDAWHRQYKNFIVTNPIPATPALLEAIGVDQSYMGYFVSTQRNLPDEMDSNGWDVGYKQELKFLPSWARGVTVFANYSRQRFSGPGAASSNLFVAVAPHIVEPYTANWGISFNRPKFDFQANWNYKARARMNYFVATDSYLYYTARTFVDLTANYRPFKKWPVGFYAAVSNLRNEKEQRHEWVGASGATPAGARERRELEFGPLWTIGIKGTF